jgi:hypothetical protein
MGEGFNLDPGCQESGLKTTPTSKIGVTDAEYFSTPFFFNVLIFQRLLSST